MAPASEKPLTKTPSTGSATDAKSSDQNNEGVQGEGDYKAAREFDEAEKKFVESGKVAAAARAAAPRSEAERQAMISAEREGKRRAKGEDSALTKAWPDPATTRVAEKDADPERG
jgi:hypothetical protein